MKVGAVLFFQNYLDRMTDRKVWDDNLHIGTMLEPLGYDFVGVVEHHFEGYSTTADNLQILSYLAAKTERIGLMTSAVILPWNDPLRVAERILVLDQLSNGRAMFGMGRGLARMEYERFGVDMNEARERFDESAKIVMQALETGILESGDKHYKRHFPVDLRPKPFKSFKDRTFAVAMSSDSLPVVAELGAAMLAFSGRAWEEMAEPLRQYRTIFAQHHPGPAPDPVFCNFLLCDQSADRAQALAHEHVANYYDALIDHYEMAGSHFKNIKGYGDYALGAEQLREQADLERKRTEFVGYNDIGTPTQILEEYERRRNLLGDFDLILNVIYGGLTVENSESSVRLFAEKVLPELKSWGSGR